MNNHIRKHTLPDGKEIIQRLYYCEPYLGVWCPEKSCVFCKNCDDVIYDFTNGPYMFFCDKDKNGEKHLTEKGYAGECVLFDNDWEEIERRNNEIETLKKKTKMIEKDKAYKDFIKEFQKAVADTILLGENTAKAMHEARLKELAPGFSKAWNSIKV